MGVLARLFRKSSPEKREFRQTQSSVDRNDRYPGVQVEAKRPAQETDDRPGDQASRLREEVLHAQKTHESAEDFESDFAGGDSEAVPGSGNMAHYDRENEDELRIIPDADDDPSGQPALSRKSRSPRSKQELIEELHRNYIEVLGLVRKLDGHLDEARERAETVTEIAEAYSKLAPLFESLPNQVRDHTQALGTDIRSAVAEEGSAARELLERIESAIVHVGTDIERSTNQQGCLVQTMAEFRESLTDLSKSSTAACEAVRDSEARAARRDEAMLNQLRQTRYWLVGLTIGFGVIGISALVLGFLALKG